MILCKCAETVHLFFVIPFISIKHSHLPYFFGQKNQFVEEFYRFSFLIVVQANLKERLNGEINHHSPHLVKLQMKERISLDQR